MKTKNIVIVEDFHPRPYGRDRDDEPTGERTGFAFRKKILAPALKEYDKVHVDLDGYNRYGPSFLDEAFGGLIREDGFTPDEILQKLTYSHSKIRSIELIIKDRIDASIAFYRRTHGA